MKIRKKPQANSSFLKLYLQQLFATDIYVRFINPFKFWHIYQANRLEDCWEFNTVRYFKRCHQIEWQPETQKRSLENNQIAGNYRGVPWEKAPPNAFLISQPIELKYRGVVYRTNSVVLVNKDRAELQSQPSVLDEVKKTTSDSENNNKFSSTPSNISQSN